MTILSSQSNLYLITGTDTGEIEAAAKKLASKLTGDDPDPFLCDTIIESDTISPQAALKQTIDSIQSPPFFGGQKTVWLKNTSAFEEENKTGVWGELYERLYSLIEQGVPEDIQLILSGAKADRRKKLYKLCEKHGSVFSYEKPDINRSGWEQKMSTAVERRAEDMGMRLQAPAIQHLVQSIGSNTSLIEPELEKLFAFHGYSEKPVPLETARQVCRGDGENSAWAMRDAMGSRRLDEVLALSKSTLEASRDQKRDVMGMIRQTSDHFFILLQIILLMRILKTKSPDRLSSLVKNMDDTNKQQWADKGFEIIRFHPYRLKMAAKQAVNYHGQELVQAVKILRDAYWEIITTSASSQVLWEETALKIIQKKEIMT